MSLNQINLYFLRSYERLFRLISGIFETYKGLYWEAILFFKKTDKTKKSKYTTMLSFTFNNYKKS